MALFDQAAFSRALDELNEETQRTDFGPTRKQTLSRITIVCLLLNRMIGAGIFVVPANVIRATGGSVGISLILWAVGGIIAFAGLYVWLEFGLSTPRHDVRGRRLGVPRSGGEKNYLEYVFSKPERLTTCMFGIAFVILGNRAGNAYAFGTYVMNAAGYNDPSRGSVVGIAIAGMTAAVALHMFTRSGGIWINNIFGIFKGLLLLAIIILGAIKAGGNKLGGSPDALDNYDASFHRISNDPSGIAQAFIPILYAYGGFEQPFYVLSEFRRPRKWFPLYTALGLALVTVLFVGVNAAYLFVVPLKDIMDAKQGDIASLFLQRVFGNQAGQRAMSALIAVSIFGNLIVTTFTLARVKQEIAKEGILPASLILATSHTTPAAKIAAWWRRNVRHKPVKSDDLQDDHDHQEQAPMAALLLHLFFAIVLVAITSFLDPSASYNLLVNIYTYSLVVVVGFFVSGGMLILKLVPSRGWSSKTYFQRVPWLISLIPATFYFLCCSFLIIIGFFPPITKPAYPYYVVPIIGLSSPLWGAVWWCLLQLHMKRTHTKLVVSRVPYVVPDPDIQGQYIQKAELIDHEWHSALRQRQSTVAESKGPAVNVEYHGMEYDRAIDHDRSAAMGGRYDAAGRGQVVSYPPRAVSPVERDDHHDYGQAYQAPIQPRSSYPMEASYPAHGSVHQYDREQGYGGQGYNGYSRY